MVQNQNKTKFYVDVWSESSLLVCKAVKRESACQTILCGFGS